MNSNFLIIVFLLGLAQTAQISRQVAFLQDENTVTSNDLSASTKSFIQLDQFQGDIVLTSADVSLFVHFIQDENTVTSDDLNAPTNTFIQDDLMSFGKNQIDLDVTGLNFGDITSSFGDDNASLD